MNTISNNKMFNKFKSWRLEKASEKGWRPYMILHNKVLDNIIDYQPTSINQLKNIEGLGPFKIKEYGQDIISILNNNKSSINSVFEGNNMNNSNINYNFFDNIYKSSIEKCTPSYSWDREQWQLTDRGKAILSSDEQCEIYNKYYAGRHYNVLNDQFDKLFNNYNDFWGNSSKYKNIVINDYGCGQGFATFLFLENLIKNNHQLDSLTINIIEPSRIALNRAKKYIQKLIISNKILNNSNSQINFIESKLSGLSRSKFYKQNKLKNDDYINVHLFSNILDIECIDIEQLIDDINKYNKGTNFFIANSPVYNETINRFESLENSYFWDDEYTEIQSADSYLINSKQYFFKENSNRLTNKKIKYCGLMFNVRIDDE